ncbi:MAG TPA: hypothetical protein IAA63_09555 [Candidatus Pullilachnospira stercoravium]|uniref:PIN domain-containing protein n=1 Tax=Candidatus Pullilachnospira stercoravium TaxID=2840913 RepID=A0A9D1NWA6_9FIRM|nr:hypothetical protein [Candidatus Pullilachnospira stercoravium]
MRASLDTNVVIHIYRAGLEDILFDFFSDGVFIYEQIRKIELEHHGQDILEKVDADIKSGKIEVYTDETLKQQAVLRIFENNVNENKLLYGSGDLGEVYAISLAQTIGAYSLVTDDIKQGGPYMSLLQLEYDIMPFTFADILILRYLIEAADAEQTVRDFNMINEVSDLKWSFRSQIVKFIKRFWKDPYKNEEKKWMSKLVEERKIRVKSKFTDLQKLL